MANLKDLHELIHSLDKYEKIQISRNISALGGKSKERYYNDYQCIAKVKTYNKEILKEKLNKIELRKNLSESNTNLYNFINDILIKIHQNKNKKLGLLRDLQVSELLFDKGLIEQSEKIHNQSLAKSINIGSDCIQLHLYGNEDKFLLRKKNKPSNSFEIRKLNIQKQIDHIESIKYKLELTMLKKEVYKIASEIGTPRTQEHLNKYLELYNNHLFTEKPKLISKEALYEYYDLKILLSAVTQEETVIILLAEKALKEIQYLYDKKNNPLPEYHLIMYLVEINAFEKNYEKLNKSIELLNKIGPYINSEVQKTIIKTKTIWAWLLHFLYCEELEKAYDYLVENKTTILDERINKLSAFNYINIFTAARICFLNNKHEESLDFISVLLSKENGIRSTLSSHILFLSLLNHYKLHNKEYLPYAIKSVYRTILKQKTLYEPEKILLSFLRKAVNKVNIESEFKKLYKKLLPLSKEKFHQSFFGNGDYILWLKKEIDTD